MIKRILISLILVLFVAGLLSPVLSAANPPGLGKVPVELQPKDGKLLEFLQGKGVDRNYVRLEKDYGPRDKGGSPYSVTYNDLKSNLNYMLVSGIPHSDAFGIKLDSSWYEFKGRFYSGYNLFWAIVDGNTITVAANFDQPNGSMEDDQVSWSPQLFINGEEIQPRAPPILLPVDPINPSYLNNTISWDYGDGIERTVRVIEGRIREWWTFSENPQGEVRIEHNVSGSLPLILGRGEDATYESVEVTVTTDDEEIISVEELDRATYPIGIGASPETFYPDPDVEVSSVDGSVHQYDGFQNWAWFRDGAGKSATDDSSAGSAWYLKSGGAPGEWEVLRRGVFLFDTSGLPDTAEVTDATFSLFGRVKEDAVGRSLDLNVYSSAPASNDELVAGDYNSLGTTAYSDTDITFAAFSVVAYNDWVFNVTGIAAIDKEGVTKLGTRDATHDAGDVEPTWGIATTFSYFGIYFAEQGDTTNDPKLVVTYIAGPSVTTDAASSVEETTATLNGEVTDVNDTDITDRGFVWDLASQGDPGHVAPGASGYANNWTENGVFGTGVFTRDITGLTKGELYYVRACAQNDSPVWSYGDEVTFLTKPDAPDTLVATAGDQQVGLTWNKGTGAQNSILRGKIDGYPASYDTDTAVYDDTGVSTTHSGLTNGDHWYYRIWSYATEGGKEQYSDTYAQADATPVYYPLVTTHAATLVGLDTGTLNGEVTSLEDGNVTDRGFVWDTVARGNPGNAAPGATAYANNWSENGDWGVGTFSHAAAFVEGQTYYARAGATNDVGWRYGDEITFSMLGMVLWFEPISMINSNAVADMSGWANHGTVNWGANPDDILITLEGMESFTSYIPPGGEGADPPTVLPEPTGFTLFGLPDVDCTGMPLYPLVNRCAVSLGFTAQIMYSILMLITAMAFGFGALIATGTMWGFAAGFGITMGAAGGTGIPPWWLVIFPILFAIFVAYLWRQT